GVRPRTVRGLRRRAGCESGLADRSGVDSVLLGERGEAGLEWLRLPPVARHRWGGLDGRRRPARRSLGLCLAGVLPGLGAVEIVVGRGGVDGTDVDGTAAVGGGSDRGGVTGSKASVVSTSGSGVVVVGRFHPPWLDVLHRRRLVGDAAPIEGAITAAGAAFTG